MKIEDLIDLFRGETRRSRSEAIHIWAVFWANFKIFLSYRTWVVTETLSTVASIVMYSFMGLQVDAARIVEAGYGPVSWLSFAIVGVATANYLWMCTSRISHSLQHEVSEGTLEPIVSSQINMRSYIIGQSLRGFIVSSYFMLGVLLIGLLLLRVPLIINPWTLISFVLILLMMIVSYAGIGIMAAGLILVYKKGDPLTFLIASLTEFLGGVLFPLKYLEPYPILNMMAWAMPYTYALDAARWVLLTGADLTSAPVLYDVAILAAYTLIFLPIGMRVFKWGCDRIRREGTVATY
ncbi:MAG: ABC transporter permease [Nitrososphaerota archaeon]|nr:ABC transporter permease [Candidatus Bathyarchaeota archaeon]MDW8048164.1 ABC transporter permease [Nitrososphaerota archaeon]